MMAFALKPYGLLSGVLLGALSSDFSSFGRLLPKDSHSSGAPHRTQSPSYTKKGPGREHRSGAGKPRCPSTPVIAVKPERMRLYMHSHARQMAALAKALGT